MLDRIDMHIHLSRVSIKDLQKVDSAEERSTLIRSRVAQARTLQVHKRGKLNSRFSSSDIDYYCKIPEPEMSFMEMACDKLNMSARAYHRVLRISRTIADMQGRENITKADIAEALRLRSLDRKV